MPAPTRRPRAPAAEPALVMQEVAYEAAVQTVTAET